MVFEENKKTPACDILYCNNWQKVGFKVFSGATDSVQYDSADMQDIMILKWFFSIFSDCPSSIER